MRGGGCSAIYGQWCELEGEKRSNAVIYFIIVNFFFTVALQVTVRQQHTDAAQWNLREPVEHSDFVIDPSFSMLLLND